MKRIRNKIIHNETGRFKVNQVTEIYYYQYFDTQTGPYISALYQSSYQICNVYTDQNTVLSAYQKLNGEEATNEVFLDHDNNYIPTNLRYVIRDKIIYNDRFNCHGFTFLDAQFWFELDNETVNLILREDHYQECTFENLNENGICLYYTKEKKLLHSARIVNGNLLSKFGINDVLTKGQDDILTRYKLIDHSNTMYFNRQ